MLSKLPRMLRRADGSSLVPPGSIWLSTSGVPGHAPLGLILSRSKIPESEFTNQAQKAFYKGFGHSALKSDDFTTMMSNPPRAVFTRDRHGQPRLTIFKPGGSFGAQQSSLVTMHDPVTGICSGFPTDYEARLRRLMNKSRVSFNGDSSVTAAAISGIGELHGRGLASIWSDLSLDGWTDVTDVEFAAWLGSSKIPVSTSGNMGAASCDLIGGRWIAKAYFDQYLRMSMASPYPGSTLQARITPGNLDVGVSNTSPIPHLCMSAADDPSFVYMLVSCGAAHTAGYAHRFSILKRHRRSEDGDVAVWLCHGPNGVISNGTVYRDKNPPAVGAEYLTRAPADVTYSRAAPANLKSRVNSAHKAVSPVKPPPGVMVGPAPDGLFSEVFFVYGWAAITEHVHIDYDAENVRWEELDGSDARLHLEELTRSSYLSTTRLSTFLTARAEGMQGADRLSALEVATKVSTVGLAGYWLSSTRDPLLTELSDIITYQPFSGVSDRLEDWLSMRVSVVDENGVTVEKSFPEAKGELKEVYSTFHVVPTNGAVQAIDSLPACLVSRDAVTGIISYSIDGEVSNRDDVLTELLLGASLTLTRTSWPDAFGYGSLAEAALKHPVKKGMHALFSEFGVDGRTAYQDASSKALAGFHHVLQGRDKNVQVLNSFDFHSFNQSIRVNQ